MGIDLRGLFGGLGEGLQNAGAMLHENWLSDKRRREEMEDWMAHQAITDAAETARQKELRRMAFEHDDSLRQEDILREQRNKNFNGSLDLAGYIQNPIDPKMAAAGAITPSGLPLPILQRVVAATNWKKVQSGEVLTPEDIQNQTILSTEAQAAILDHQAKNMTFQQNLSNAQLEARDRLANMGNEGKRLALSEKQYNLSVIREDDREKRYDQKITSAEMKRIEDEIARLKTERSSSLFNIRQIQGQQAKARSNMLYTHYLTLQNQGKKLTDEQKVLVATNGNYIDQLDGALSAQLERQHTAEAGIDYHKQAGEILRTKGMDEYQKFQPQATAGGADKTAVPFDIPALKKSGMTDADINLAIASGAYADTNDVLAHWAEHKKAADALAAKSKPQGPPRWDESTRSYHY